MLTRYLQELNKVQLLSEEAEQILWKMYKEEGDRNARQEIITAYQPLVYKIVAEILVSNDLVMDLIQEGIIGLIEAVENFQYQQKVRFSTYAKYRIRGRVLNFLKRDLKIDWKMISLDHISDDDGRTLLDKLSKEGLSLENQVEERYLYREVLRAIQRLPQKEQKAIKALLFGGEDAQTIAERMQISPGHLYRLQRKAIKRIRGMLSGLMKEFKRA